MSSTVTNNGVYVRILIPNEIYDFVERTAAKLGCTAECAVREMMLSQIPEDVIAAVPAKAMRRPALVEEAIAAAEKETARERPKAAGVDPGRLSQIQYLHSIGMTITGISAHLRVTYAEVNAAISSPRKQD